MGSGESTTVAEGDQEGSSTPGPGRPIHSLPVESTTGTQAFPRQSKTCGADALPRMRRRHGPSRRRPLSSVCVNSRDAVLADCFASRRRDSADGPLHFGVVAERKSADEIVTEGARQAPLRRFMPPPAAEFAGSPLPEPDGAIPDARGTASVFEIQ